MSSGFTRGGLGAMERVNDPTVAFRKSRHGADRRLVGGTGYETGCRFLMK